MIGEFKIFGTKLTKIKKLIVNLKWILLFWTLSAAIAIFGTFVGRIGRPPPSPYEIHRMWVGLILTGAGFSTMLLVHIYFVQLYGYFIYDGSGFQRIVRLGKRKINLGSKLYISRLEWVLRDPIGNLVFIFKGANRKMQIRFQQQTEAEIENIVSIVNKDRDSPLAVANRDRLSNFILRNIDPDMTRRKHDR